MTKFTKINVFFVIFVVFLLFLSFFDGFLGFSPVRNLFEKRILNEAPNFPSNRVEFVGFSREFEKFFDDNYGFRKTLVSLNSWILDNIFNQSPSDRALIGSDGWFYFDNKDSILDAQGLALVDADLLEKMALSFVRNWEGLRLENIDYVLVIAADKTSIYPQFLPKYIKFSEKNHRIDEFLRILRRRAPNFPVLDLRQVLNEAKKGEIVYHKTDTHWNARGAHYAYVEIMKKLGLGYNGRDEYEEVSDGYYKGDISDIMNVSTVNVDYDLKPKFTRSFVNVTDDEFREKFYKPNVFVNAYRRLPVLFVYKDSFFDNMMYFFAQNFSKSYFVNEFPCDLDLNMLKKYQADVVIQEFWEGRIGEVANKCE